MLAALGRIAGVGSAIVVVVAIQRRSRRTGSGLTSFSPVTDGAVGTGSAVGFGVGGTGDGSGLAVALPVSFVGAESITGKAGGSNFRIDRCMLDPGCWIARICSASIAIICIDRNMLNTG